MMNGGCALGNTRRTAMFSMFTYMWLKTAVAEMPATQIIIKIMQILDIGLKIYILLRYTYIYVGLCVRLDLVVEYGNELEIQLLSRYNAFMF